MTIIFEISAEDVVTLGNENDRPVSLKDANQALEQMSDSVAAIKARRTLLSQTLDIARMIHIGQKKG